MPPAGRVARPDFHFGPWADGRTLYVAWLAGIWAKGGTIIERRVGRCWDCSRGLYVLHDKGEGDEIDKCGTLSLRHMKPWAVEKPSVPPAQP